MLLHDQPREAVCVCQRVASGRTGLGGARAIDGAESGLILKRLLGHAVPIDRFSGLAGQSLVRDNDVDLVALQMRRLPRGDVYRMMVQPPVLELIPRQVLCTPQEPKGFDHLYGLPKNCAHIGVQGVRPYWRR